MIFRLSKYVNIEHKFSDSGIKRKLTFLRPPGSKQLDWVPRARRMWERSRKSAEGEFTLPVDAPEYKDMVADIAKYLVRVDDEDEGLPMSAEDLDNEVDVGDLLTIWSSFFEECQVSDSDKKKSKKLSKQEQQSMEKQEKASTTVQPVQTAGVQH